MASTSRWLVGIVVVVLAVTFADCGMQRRALRKSEPTPVPGATPRPLRTKALPSPSPMRSVAPDRDTTRDPLSRMANEATTARDASALKLADRARAELNSGTTDKAFELLDSAIETSPKLAPLYVLRARAFLAEGNAESARADIDKAAALPAPTVWVAETAAMRGAIFEVEGNRTEALSAYRRALRIFPGNQTANDALKRLEAPQ
jgi:tetratricopeptide (TPR) repeat protein